MWPISGDRDQGNHLTAGVSTQLSSVIMSPADNHLNCCLFSRKPDWNGPLIVSTRRYKTTIFELGLIRLLLQVLLQQWNVMKMSDNRIYHSKCLLFNRRPVQSRFRRGCWHQLGSYCRMENHCTWSSSGLASHSCIITSSLSGSD